MTHHMPPASPNRPRSSRRIALGAVALACISSLSAACSNKTCTGFDAPARPADRVELVTDFGPNQVTGVAVSSRGRIFVNFPDWRGMGSPQAAMAVAEVLPDGSISPYPNLEWNGIAESTALVSSALGAGWTDADGTHIAATSAGHARSDSLFDDEDDRPDPGILPGDRFVSVQSVHIDARDRLWILDSANPSFAGVQYAGGGPKLIEVDLRTNAIARVIRFDPDTVPFDAYLNDVRIDVADQVAFITDSGLGAIIVVDLVSHRARRLLDDHPSTKADPKVVPNVGGLPWVLAGPGGSTPQVHSDGLALDERNKILYWQALTGERLYAIDSRLLTSRTVPAWQIANSVRDLGPTTVTDGMWSESGGDLFFTSLEVDSVTRINGADLRRAFRQGVTNDWRNRLRTIATDHRLGWPDSLAIGPVGPTGPTGEFRPGGRWLYVTTSQIHRLPAFIGGAGATPAGSGVDGSMGYALYRIRLQ
ncbi:MAG: hypothetical protein KF768_10860 [Phycisphaeraceae bacterium]|nr:hypothetical protein [Phycisphaeraceae bacterium]